MLVRNLSGLHVNTFIWFPHHSFQVSVTVAGSQVCIRVHILTSELNVTQVTKQTTASL